MTPAAGAVELGHDVVKPRRVDQVLDHLPVRGLGDQVPRASYWYVVVPVGESVDQLAKYVIAVRGGAAADRAGNQVAVDVVLVRRPAGLGVFVKVVGGVLGRRPLTAATRLPAASYSYVVPDRSALPRQLAVERRSRRYTCRPRRSW